MGLLTGEGCLRRHMVHRIITLFKAPQLPSDGAHRQDVNSMYRVLPIIAAIQLGAVGMIALFYPRKIQRWALTGYLQRPAMKKLNPFVDWMKTAGYIKMVRFFGVFCLLIALFCVVISMVGRPPT